jgi:hypothetical protein
MTPLERYLVHQIHPAKLLTDAASGFASLIPLWWHELGFALVVMLIPPPIASALVLTLANLERQRDSPFGRYVVRTMTRSMEAVRLGGFVVIAVGAWVHLPFVMVIGLAVILFGWTRGLLTAHRVVR